MNEKVPKYVGDALTVLQARLNPKDPGFNGSDEIAEALGDKRLRCYLDTWARSMLDSLTEWATGEGEGFPDWQRRSAGWDAMKVRSARDAAGKATDESATA